MGVIRFGGQVFVRQWTVPDFVQGGEASWSSAPSKVHSDSCNQART